MKTRISSGATTTQFNTTLLLDGNINASAGFTYQIGANSGQVLSVVFDKRSTLGLVRIRSRRGAETLDEVFRTLFEKVGIAETPQDSFEAAPEFAAAAANEVDALFGE